MFRDKLIELSAKGLSMGIVSLAVIKLSLVASLGFILYRKKIVSESALSFLTFFVINLSIPFLFFSHLVENSQMVLAHSVGSFLIASFGIFIVGCAIGFIFTFKEGKALKAEIMSLVALQNAGYLPMNIAIFLFPPGAREKFLVYIFLYLLGFNILMWSVGSFFIFRKKNEVFRIKSMLTPPVIGTVLALVFIYTNIARFIPQALLSPIKMVGETSFILSMIILGCWLGKVKLEGISKKLLLVCEVSFLKLIVLPAIFLIGLVKLEIFSFLGLFIILEATMPSAASLPIVANLRGADSEFVSQGVFLTHILSIVTIPLWVGLYLAVSGPLF